MLERGRGKSVYWRGCFYQVDIHVKLASASALRSLWVLVHAADAFTSTVSVQAMKTAIAGNWNHNKEYYYDAPEIPVIAPEAFNPNIKQFSQVPNILMHQKDISAYCLRSPIIAKLE